MINTNILHIIASEISKALFPIKKATASADDFEGFMREMGWTVEDIPQPIQNLSSVIQELDNALAPIRSGKATPTQFKTLIEKIKNLIDEIQKLKTANFDPELAAANFAAKFPKQLVQYLIIEYLRTERPQIGHLFQILGIIRFSYETGSGKHPDFIKREFVWNDIPEIITNPFKIFENVFEWGTEDFASQQIYQLVQDYLLVLGVPAFLEELEEDIVKELQNTVTLPGDPNRLALNLPLFESRNGTKEIATGFKLFGLPKSGVDLPGLVLLPYATSDFEKEFPLSEKLFLTITSNLDVQGGIGIKLRPNKDIEVIKDIYNPTKASVAKGNLVIRIVNRDVSGDPIILIGSDDGSHLEYKALSLVGGLYLYAKDEVDLYIELELEGGKILIKPSKGDNFLKKILPSNGIGANFDLALGISKETGFYFRGSGGLEINIPAHLSVGPIDLQSFTIGIKPGNGKIPIELGSTVKTELGPLTAVVQNMGLSAKFSFPDTGGNLGPINLDLDFKPPTGIGLTIDGQGFKGGGFLLFDHDNQRYAGALELEFQNTISLKAIGLITTKLPGGEKGFSLLIIISAEFTPIQLGYGFTLNGVGGLLGLNRTMKVQRLLTGIKDNTLKSILFPTNIIANADRIISDLRQVFPPEQDRFVFGPMAKIGWGTPTLITIELGVIIEVPNPIRIALLGVLKALLPDEKLRLLRIQVNFLGVLDFQKQRLAFDASLYDSTLLRYTLSGDMALRLLWGNNPNFLLTVGGFHPAYNPPPVGLMNLVRLTLNLLGGKNPRLTLETYFAVTSNTVQFGAKIELYAAAWKFNVYGFLSFDVLFQFSPFYFIASIRAMLAVRIGSTSLFSVGLSLTLAGPTPWKAKGTAKFKICWFITVKVRFSKTFGESRDTCLPDIKVMPLLQSAIKNKGNWQAHIPPHSHLQVSIREIDDTGKTIIVHPFGILTVSQKVVPLNLKIDKFGNQKPKDTNQFRINEVRSNGDVLATTDVEEFFAPAQFFEMEDAQRLSRKSFEKYPSGVRIAASEKLNSDHYTKKDVEYELTYIDTRLVLVFRGEKYTPPLLAFAALLNGNAIAKSDLAFAKKAKSPLAPKEVTVKQERFAVVGTSDLKLFAGTELASSEAKAYNNMSELIANDSDLADKIQVVPQYEVNMT